MWKDEPPKNSPEGLESCAAAWPVVVGCWCALEPAQQESQSGWGGSELGEKSVGFSFLSGAADAEAENLIGGFPALTPAGSEGG